MISKANKISPSGCTCHQVQMFEVSTQGEVNPNCWNSSKFSTHKPLIIVLNCVTNFNGFESKFY
ncbi:hypothetical protein KFK09_029284 [Dendrobium nobile]|uniref:Uncharacterized protein n=1 Tax=Dendrobium nobile TaxID=94219 RepID=A0A8T3A5B1_DENNO|nr:hypothetical protein KFK09_029284 [Dendrobium nobile]